MNGPGRQERPPCPRNTSLRGRPFKKHVDQKILIDIYAICMPIHKGEGWEEQRLSITASIPDMYRFTLEKRFRGRFVCS